MAEPFRLPLRIYWEDTDAGGVVFYANYLKFFERARTEWLRSLGHEQEALRRDHGTLFVVSETSLRYLRPARLDDQIEVTVEMIECRGASMRLAQQAWRNDSGTPTLLAEGTIRIGCVAVGTFAPRRIPNDLLNATR
ncbi:MAG: tol-pal system-associated acyl-CoA thioesterase [Burkholderiaceae bacterium]